MKRQSVLHGSLLLMGSAIAAKLLGAIFRIPLTTILGGEGMGYFSSAYGLFLPIFSLSVTGINTAVAALTAQLLSKHDDGAAWLLYRRMLWIFGILGLGASLLLFALAQPLCTHFLHNPGAALAVQCFSPAIFFCCINAVLRGTWEGRQDMRPTAYSQAAESAARLVFGLLFVWILGRHMDTVLPLLPPTATSTQSAAAAAILGVTCSTAVGTLLLGCFRLPKRPTCPTKTDRHTLTCALLRILLPISAAALVTNLTSLVDLATGIRGLESMLAQHLPFETGYGTFSTSNEAANFLYGAFTGMAVTIFNLVPSVTNMLGKGVLPAFAGSYAVCDRTAMSAHARDALRATAFLAMPAGLGIAVLAKPILTLLFPARPEEVAVAAPPLMLLGVAVIALAMSFPLMSMLQAADAALPSALGMLWGVAVKLVCNLLLIPRMGLMGMALSTLLCYTVILLRMAWIFRKHTGIAPQLLSICGKPLLASSLCAATAGLTYPLLLNCLPQAWSVLLAIAMGGGVYLLCAWCLDLTGWMWGRHVVPSKSI